MPEYKSSLIPYSTPRDTFYLNRAGALRVLKMQVDFSFCQQAGKLKDSVIAGYKILYGISEQKGADLERISAGQVQKITKQRKIILRQRIAGVGIIAVLVLSVLSG